MKIRANGGVTVLLGSGEQVLSPADIKELFSLLDQVKQRGRGSPELVIGWMRIEPRRLQPLLASALANQGYQADCPLCGQGADGRRYSVASARRIFGVGVHHQQLLEHRRHARKRRPYRPTEGRPANVPAPWERAEDLEGDGAESAKVATRA
jgi:hypothetical protein